MDECYFLELHVVLVKGIIREGMRVVYLNIVFALSSFQSSFVGEVQEVHFSSCLSFFSRRMGLALSLVSDVKEKVTYMGYL